jgi:hypothetical protein
VTEMDHTMHAIVDFLTAHLTGFLVGTVGSVAAWLVLNLIGKPLLQVREQRLDALHIAERYAYFRWSEEDARVREVRRELFDIASKLRAQARGQSWPLRCYCWLLRYDLEGAAGALRGLGNMAGDTGYADQVRQNNLNHVYISLRAHRHLSREALRAHRDMVVEARREKATAEGQ